MASLNHHLDRPKRAPLIKTRFLIIILTTMCPIVCYISRQNLAIAIVSMVKSDSPDVMSVNSSISTSLNATQAKQPEPAIASVHHNTCPAPTVVNADGREELAPVTITYGPKYDWDSADRGLLFQAFFLTYVACQIPGARLAEMIGAKWILATAAIGSSLISLLTPLAASTHLYVFAVARAIMGVCQAALYPACYVLYTQWLPPRERSQALPMLGAGAYIGSIIASTTTGFFSEQAAFGWQWAFYMPGIVCAIWSVLWVYVAASEPRQQRFISLEEIDYIESRLERAPVAAAGARGQTLEANTKKVPDWFKIFTSQHIWAMVVAFLASNWAFTITLLLLPSYLNDILHIPPFRNGLINSVIYILFCLSSPVVGAISTLMIETRPLGMTHLQTRKFFQCTAILSQAISFILIPRLGCDTGLVLAVLYVQIVLFSFINGGEVQLPSELSVDFTGTIYAIGNCVGSSTGFLVPEVHKWIVKNSHARDQWNQYFYVASALTTIGAIIFWVFGKNDLQDFSKSDKTRHQQACLPSSFFELSVDKTHSINEKGPKDGEPVVRTLD